MSRVFKKIPLLFAMMFIMSGAILATESTAIGTGTSQSSAYPFYGNMGSEKCQIIYDAEELYAAGLRPGCLISAIELRQGTISSNVLQNFQIKLANTSNAAFTTMSMIQTGLTTVRQPGNLRRDSLPYGTDSFSVFTFNNNYVWNGTSGLLVELSWFNNQNTGNGTSSVFTSSTNSTFKIMYRRQNNVTSYNDFLITGTGVTTQRPNIKFRYTVNGAWASFSPRFLDFGYVEKTNPAVPGAATAVGITAGNLNPSNGGLLTLTSPSPEFFEISTSQSGPFSQTVTIPYTGSSLNTNVYVRFNGSTVENSYSEYLTLSGGSLVDSVSRILTFAHTDMEYCTPTVTMTTYHDIGKFHLANLDNQSTPTLDFYNNAGVSPAPGYSDFRNTVNPAILTRGQRYPYTVNIVESASSTYNLWVKVYADWNRDSQINNQPNSTSMPGVANASESGELLDSMYVSSANLDSLQGILNDSLTIPAGAPYGEPITLRVVAASIASMTSCGLSGFGESEDYNVILPAPGTMVYDSTDILPYSTITSTCKIGSTDQIVNTFNIVTHNSYTPLSLNRVKFVTDGVTNVSDITNGKVWYMGSSTSVLNTATARLFGRIETINNGENIIIRSTDSTNLELAEGNNYFAITYDINPNAVIGDFVDCRLSGLTFYRGATVQTPITIVNGDLAGHREIRGPMSGVYTVGGPQQSSRWYPRLISAIRQINSLGLSGDVFLELAGDEVMTGDTAALFGGITSEGGNHKVYIYPKTNVNISGISTYGLITFSGTNDVVIDGRINRTGAIGLTFQKNSASGTCLIGLYRRTKNGVAYPCSNITVQYVNFVGYSNGSSASRGIYVGGTLHSNININHCNFSKLYYGFQQYGGNLGEANTNISFTDNTIGATGNNYVTIGYYCGWTDSLNVSKNIFDGIGNESISNEYQNAGINLTAYNKNVKIDNNVIKNVNSNFGTSAAAFGIKIAENNNNVLISNNRISDIHATGGTLNSTLYSPMGISIDADTNVRIYNNTIAMRGAMLGNNTASSAAIGFVASNASQIVMENNILINTMTAGAGAYYAVMAPLGTSFLTSGYNDLYVSGNLNKTAYVNGSVIESIGAWKIAGSDNSSVAKAVEFTDDLHLNGSSAVDNDLVGINIPEVAVDMDGINRRTAPEATLMGADETDPYFNFTTNLNTTPVTDLCVPAEYNFTVANNITGFGDGIVRTAGVPNISYQWYRNGEKIDNMQNVTGEDGTVNSIKVNSPTFTAQVNQASSSEVYYVKAMLAGKSLQSASATLKAEAAAVITENPKSNLQICTDKGFTDLTVKTTGTVAGFQWQKKINGVWTSLPGYTDSTIRVFLDDKSLGTGDYRAIVMNGANHCGGYSQIESSPTHLVVVDPVYNAVIGSPVASDNKIDVCEGSDFAIVLDMNKIHGDIFAYKWQIKTESDWKDVTGEIYNDSILVFSNARPSQSGTYRLIVTGSDLCSIKTAESNPISVNIRPYLTILNQPETQIVCKGNKIRLSVKPEGQNPAYQWYKNGKAISLTENVTADKPVFTIDEADFSDAASYHCVINVNGCNKDGNEGTLVSDFALVYVMQETRIIKQPQSAKVIPGGDAVFEVKAHATGAPDDYMAEYQWYKNATPLVDGEKYSGSKSSLLTVKNCGTADFTGTFHVVVTGLCGDASISNEVNIIEATAQFATNPQSANVCSGEKATFTAEAVTTISPATINYAWHFVDANNVDAVMPSTASTMTVEANAQTAGTYYCVATVEPAGVVITSSNATLQVSNAPAIKTPVADVTVATGEAIKLAEAVTGTNPITYKWFLNNEELLDFTGKDTLTTTATAAGTYNYRFEASNACGTVTDEITVTVTAGGKSGVEDAIKGVSLSDVMPNPVNGLARFTVTSDASRNAEITLLDAAGRTVSTIFNGMIDGTRTLDLNADGLASGSYFLNLTINGKTISKHVVIAK